MMRLALTRWARGLLTAVLAAFLFVWASVAQANALSLTQANASIRVEGVLTQAVVSLPYSWDRAHQGQQGEARFVMRFDLPEAPADAWGVYLQRAGSAYEVWLNGRLLERHGQMARYNGDDFGQLPHYVNLPFGDLRQRNELEIRIRADVGRRGGLSAVVLGPVDEVYPLYRQAHTWDVTAAFLVLACIGMVALSSLGLWATQQVVTPQGALQRDRVYLYAGLAELSWLLRLSNGQFESPPLAWPWWGMLPVCALALWSGFVAFFCMELVGWKRTPKALAFRASLVFMMLSGPLAAWAALGLGASLVLTLWYAMQAVLFIGFGVWFTRQALRSGSGALQLVALAVLVNVVFALRDLYVFRIAMDYPASSWVYLSSALFGLSVGYVVAARFRAVSAQARELTSSLSSRIASREAELNASYLQLEQLAREQERAAERTRILRDMHDGVGAHISTAIQQLQSGRASGDEVLQTLRESMDQLKLTIDAMQLPRGDVTALLANLRYRLQPRFSASNVELRWAVDLIDPILRLDAQAMRQLQFMLFEALSNVLQHAQASWLRIEAVMTPEGACLRIVDNGRGFDVAAPPRNGLASLRERARAIGARLQIDSEPGRTVVEIRIPLT